MNVFNQYQPLNAAHEFKFYIVYTLSGFNCFLYTLFPHIDISSFGRYYEENFFFGITNLYHCIECN